MKSRFPISHSKRPCLAASLLLTGLLSYQAPAATLVAEYNFETTSAVTLAAGVDSSTNGNNATASGSFGSTNDVSSTNAAVGTYARLFFGDTDLAFVNPSTAFSNLSGVLGGSFSVTAWVNTTNSTGNSFDNAYSGNPILFGYNNNTDSVIPLAITGANAAFTTSDHNGIFTTLHSTSAVNDGNYHLLAITRNQTNGLMQMYVDGQFQGSVTGTTDTLDATNLPGYQILLAGNLTTGYVGLLDDVRIYSGVLSASDVAALAGQSITSFAGALNDSNLVWTTSGDTSWFVETTNTYDGTAAAQSGMVTNDQTSTLMTTVYGPGTLTFYWACQGQGANFDYEFLIDGNSLNVIYDDYPWEQDTYTLTAGPHTLAWTLYSNGDDDLTAAGFLDEVSYVPTPIVLTNVVETSSGLTFSFLSEDQLTNTVQYKTNLLTGSWQVYTNIFGDGTLKTVTIPLSTFGPTKTGFVRIHP
jgi:hypothetical protein